MGYKNEELSEEATCKEIIQVQTGGGRKVKRERPIYNLDAILSVGCRVNSKCGITFRRWAIAVRDNPTDYLSKDLLTCEYYKGGLGEEKVRAIKKHRQNEVAKGQNTMDQCTSAYFCAK